ncbi:MAG: hypothetical protein WC089_01375 [Candidatus Paceibacterota bacterium]
MDIKIKQALLDSKVEEVNCFAAYFGFEKGFLVADLNKLRIELMGSNPSKTRADSLFNSLESNKAAIRFNDDEEETIILFQKVSEAQALAYIVYRSFFKN